MDEVQYFLGHLVYSNSLIKTVKWQIADLILHYNYHSQREVTKIMFYGQFFSARKIYQTIIMNGF